MKACVRGGCKATTAILVGMKNWEINNIDLDEMSDGFFKQFAEAFVESNRSVCTGERIIGFGRLGDANNQSPTPKGRARAERRRAMVPRSLAMPN